jgi:hypothetical protein
MVRALEKHVYLVDAKIGSIYYFVGLRLPLLTWERQVLPFCADETLATLEQNILTMPSLSDSEGLTAEQITEYLLKDIGVGDYNDLVCLVFKRYVEILLNVCD